MRLLHTSDWHLGRTLHGVDLLGYQSAYLDHLVELARSEAVDAVLVSGDIYDRAFPPVDAVRLLEEALGRLTEVAPVLITSGNHDSATRLGFGAELMRPGIHLATRLAGLAQPITVAPRSGEGPAGLVYALPYLDPDAARTELAEGDAPLARSHQAVMAAAMGRVRRDLEGRDPRGGVVVMAHAFVQGGEGSDSERDIRVGGVDRVPATLFRGADYVALGHLHGPQRVAWPGGDGGVGDGAGDCGVSGVGGGTEPVLRYAGSPLAFSFSEATHTKSTVLVDVQGGATPAGPRVRCELVPAPVPRRLGDVRGTLEQLMGPAFDDRAEWWLRVEVTDQIRPPDLMDRVRARFPHALEVRHRPPLTPGARAVAEVTGSADPLAVAASFVEFAGGAAPTAAEVTALRETLEALRAAERSG
jgi:exonuclease SbcD